MPPLRYLPLSVLLLLLLAGAWWQGLYFEDQQVVAVFLLLLAALFGLLHSRLSGWWKVGFGHLLVFLLPLVLLVSSAGAVSPHLARLAWVQYLALAGVFVVVRQGARSLRELQWLQAAMLVAALWVCLFGLLAKAGLADFPAAVTKGRIGSVFQYANSFGTFAGACLLGSLAVLFYRPHPLRTLAMAGLPVLLAGLAFSYSRGAWLLVPVVFGLVLWLQPAHRRRYLAGQAFWHLLPGLVALPLLRWSVGQPALFCLVLAAAVGLSWYTGRLPESQPEGLPLSAPKPASLLTRHKAAVFLFLAVGLAALAFSFLMFTSVGERLIGAPARDTSFTARLLFNTDALRIFRDYPLTGAGGGAWPSLYAHYQSQPYYSTQLHNFLLQVLTDAGLMGVVVFLAVLFVLFRQAVLHCRRAAGVHAAASCFFLAVAAMIFLHSLLDFDLSFFYLGVVLFAALAAAGPLAEKPSAGAPLPLPAAARISGNIVYSLVQLWVIWGLVISGRQLMAIRHNEQGNQLAKAGRYAEAVPELEAAARLAPYHLGYLQATASVTEAVARYASNREQLSQSARSFRQLVALEPHNPKMHQALAGFFERNSQPDSALLAHEKAVQLAPYNWNNYEALLQSAAKAARTGTLPASAARQALSQYDTLGLRRQQLLKTVQKLRRRFAYSETMHLHAAQLAFQLADYERSAGLASLVLQSDNPKARQLAQAYWQLSHQRLGSATVAAQDTTPAPEKQLEAVRLLPLLK